MFNDTWEPFVSLRQAMDQLLNESFVGGPFRTLWAQPGTNQATWTPIPLDVYATNDELVILAAVPGLSPDQLQITYNQGTVIISGTVPDVAQIQQAQGATWYLHELPSGRFQRAVGLPFPVEVEQAKASFENGILKLVLPKAEAAKAKTIPVTAGQGAQAITAGQH